MTIILTDARFAEMKNTHRTVPRAKGGARGRGIRQVQMANAALAEAGYSQEEIDAYLAQLLDEKTAALQN